MVTFLSAACELTGGRNQSWPSDGCLGRGWRVLSTGGLGARAQDMLESMVEWFYATEYIS